MRLLLLLLVLPLAGFCSENGGDSLRSRYSEQISLDSLRHHLNFIASDAFEGRETGKPGQKMTAEYLADHFNGYGLTSVADSGYFQRFYLSETGIEKASVTVAGSELEFIEDYYFFGALVSNGKRQFNQIQFLGYGIDDSLYSDYRNAGEVIENIVIWEEEPVNRKGAFLLSGNDYNSEWSKDFSIKLKTAKKHGVKNLFIVNDDFDDMVIRLSYYLTMPRVSLWKEDVKDPKLAVYYISEKTARQLLGKDYKPAKIKQRIGNGKDNTSFIVDQHITIDIVKKSSKIATENVLGIIEGSDKKDEYLVITAHYDHLGVQNGEIYNGADDDGSGTVALLEIARAFGKAKSEGHGPSRSVLIMAVSGEEKGLLGSEYYTSNPIVPLDATVANLNIDMIGRNDAAYDPDSEYIYLIGSDRLSSTLHNLSETVNQECCRIELDYTYNDPNDPNRFYYRSDHYNFVKNGIPAIFYFSGVHEDYHQPTDTADKIQYGKMTSVVQLIFETAWEIANTPLTIEVDVEDDAELFRQ